MDPNQNTPNENPSVPTNETSSLNPSTPSFSAPTPQIITPTPSAPISSTPPATPSPAAETTTSSATSSAVPSIPGPVYSPLSAPSDLPPAPLPGQVIIAGGTPTAYPTKKWGKKKLLIIGGGTVAGLLLISGAIFGLYLPNTPNGVWKTGVNRTGSALYSVVTAATEPKKLAEYKTTTVSGDFEANFQDTKYTGNITTKFDKKNVDGGLKFTVKDPEGDRTLEAKVLSEIVGDSNYPNIYFQLSGLKAMGFDSLFPEYVQYDGKWISVDSSYIESLGESYFAGSDNTKKEVTADDVAEVARATASVTKEYLLTTDSDKGVLVKQSFVGKEKIEGLNTYHYKVGINTEHAKAYCVAFTKAMLSTKAYEKLSGATTEETNKYKAEATKDCATSVDDTIKSSDSFDVWIDSKYKIIYKFRVYDKAEKSSYTDVGQVYKGDDKLSLFVAWHEASAKSDGKFTLDTDLKTNATTGLFTFKSTNTDDPYDARLTLKATSSSTPVKITKPTDAIPLQTVLKSLGYSDSEISTPANTGSVQSKAKDTERKTDINVLMSYVENFYASNGYYPTLGNLNNASWRATNMKGLDSQAMVDPDSNLPPGLTSVASSVQYGYATTGCVNDQCTGYTLTAKLSDGTIYTKQSF